MHIVVFGAGYVGLVTGTGLSDLGHEVLLCDIDENKLRDLREGRIPIYEPGLSDLVRRNVRSGRLRFGRDIAAPFDTADAYFLAVGTPPAADGTLDVSQVLEAARVVTQVAKRDALVVVKSTVPVGTCDRVAEVLRGASVHLEAVSNPEFLKEGDAVNDFFKPDRIVIGAESAHARDVLRELYGPLQLSGERLVMTDRRSSELVKYAANAMLAMRVSFMNELSQLCHAVGANIHSVRMGIGTDSRIGKKFLFAGPGYGGSCFPKDVQALASLGRHHGVEMRLAQATHDANASQTQFVAHLLNEALGGVSKKTIAFWGLAFKPETDDIREAPAIKLAELLLTSGAQVTGHDPEGGPNFEKLFGGRVKVVARDYDALDGAHAVVLLTEWRSYRAPNFEEMKKRLASSAPGVPAVVVDARNIWRPKDVHKAGLRYVGIGIPQSGNDDRPSEVSVRDS